MRIRRSAAVLAGVLAASSLGADELNRIVLRVNDEIATLLEYRDRKDARLEGLSQAQGVTDDQRRQLAAEAGKGTMREMFDELLLVSRGRQMHIEVPPAQVESALDQQRKRFGLDSEADFKAALAESGLTIEEYRHRLERTLLMNEVVEREVTGKIKIDDEVGQRYYHDHATEYRIPERIHVQEIVVREEGTPDRAARNALAAKIAGELAGGSAFAEIAGRGAADGTTTGVIDHGWVAKGELAPELEAAVWSLAPGAISAPVAGRGGVHLLKLVEREAASMRPFADVKDEILAKQRSQIFENRLKEYMASLEQGAYVIDHAPVDAQGFRETAPPKIEDALAPFARSADSGKNTKAPKSAKPVQPPVAAPPPASSSPPPKPPPA